MALALSLAIKTHMIVPKAQQRVKSASQKIIGERVGKGGGRGEGEPRPTPISAASASVGCIKYRRLSRLCRVPRIYHMYFHFQPCHV